MKKKITIEYKRSNKNIYKKLLKLKIKQITQYLHCITINKFNMLLCCLYKFYKFIKKKLILEWIVALLFTVDVHLSITHKCRQNKKFSNFVLCTLDNIQNSTMHTKKQCHYHQQETDIYIKMDISCSTKIFMVNGFL